MKLIVAAKAVYDDQDIQINNDRTLDFSKARFAISSYDTNAIEAAAQLASREEGSSVAIVTAGPRGIDDSKLKKNLLSRGADELYLVADDACADMDSHATALVLRDMVRKIGDFDIVVCGDGSADDYAQQVDVQLACALDVPVVTAASGITRDGSGFLVERTLEDSVETVRVEAPCVVSVTPDAAVPRIPGMKEILAAGKKPVHALDMEERPEPSLETVSCAAPAQVERKRIVLNAEDEGAVEKFAAEIRAAL